MTEEIVTKAGGVNHQHARGHIALRGAQFRFTLGVKALDHLKLADVGGVDLGRRIEIELALFDELQDAPCR